MRLWEMVQAVCENDDWRFAQDEMDTLNEVLSIAANNAHRVTRCCIQKLCINSGY
jgi:hypothetical protein